jgi:hypothetical protein
LGGFSPLNEWKNMKLLTLLAVASAWSAASAANLFTNPDFETNASGWTVFLEPTDATIAATGSAKAGVGRNASAGMEVKVTTAPTDVANNWHIQLQTPQDWLAEKGKTYKLSFWAKADALEIDPPGNRRRTCLGLRVHQRF